MVMGREYHREYIKRYYAKIYSELIIRFGGKCVKCGSKDELEFDHVDPETKVFSISALLSHSKADLERELTKCQLLCRQCHIEKTLQENGQSRAEHGNPNRYGRGCRCALCKAAWAKHFRQRRARIRDLKTN